MSEMIERVARAMADGDWDAKSLFDTPNGEMPEEFRDHWRDKARAVIEAMREPTDEMWEAIPAPPTTPLVRWQAMIDAALSEHLEG